MITQGQSIILQQYIEDVHNAKARWEEAKNSFANACDPDSVDIAILEEQAALRRYLRSLKQIKAYTGSCETVQEGNS